MIQAKTPSPFSGAQMINCANSQCNKELMPFEGKTRKAWSSTHSKISVRRFEGKLYCVECMKAGEGVEFIERQIECGNDKFSRMYRSMQEAALLGDTQALEIYREEYRTMRDAKQSHASHCHSGGDPLLTCTCRFEHGGIINKPASEVFKFLMKTTRKPAVEFPQAA